METTTTTTTAPQPSTTSTTQSEQESSASSQYNHVQSIQSNNPVIKVIRKGFMLLGEVCSSQHWETLSVLFVVLFGSLTYWNKGTSTMSNINPEANLLGEEQGWIRAYIPIAENSFYILTGLWVVALPNVMHRFTKIFRIESPILHRIVGAYFCVTLFLFMIIMVALKGLDGTLLANLCFIPLLTDIPQVTRMAQFALSSSCSKRISESISNGYSIQAPTMLMDSMIKILLFGIGWQTGISELGIISEYAVASVLVNLLVFFIVYPAVLSIYLDLECRQERPTWNVGKIIQNLHQIGSQSPVVHKGKVLFLGLISILHISCLPNYFSQSDSIFNAEKWFSSVMTLGLLIRYLFNEDLDESAQMRRTYIRMNRGNTDYFQQDEFQVKEDNSDRQSNSTDEGISVDSSTKARPPSSRATDDSGSDWSEVGYLPDVRDQMVQTEVIIMDAKEESVSDSEEETETEDQVRFTESSSDETEFLVDKESRTVSECMKIFADNGAEQLTDEELVQLVEKKVIRSYSLEKELKSKTRGVKIRRRCVEKAGNFKLRGLPYLNYDYETVMGACCESVIGYMTLPLGVAGPLNLDGRMLHVPMATTEGCLVASVNRGCSALRECGVKSHVEVVGMTRGPCLTFPNISRASEAKTWLEDPDNFIEIKKEFESTSKYAKLKSITCAVSGRILYVRFNASTGDAMGMNMLSKATEKAIDYLNEKVFPDIEARSISGNYCTDKKAAAINWINGRGRSVVCEAIVPRDTVEKTLKTTPEALAYLNINKNLVGSAMAGSIGGFNAQAANVVTAIYIATGQDTAQNVVSSNCITSMEVRDADLYITTTMPSIEVATVGGGTILKPQGTCLNMLGVRGPHPIPGENASQLASIVCATVLAGELSLMSALAAGHLVKSHLKHNRSQLTFGSCGANLSKIKNGHMQISQSTPVMTLDERNNRS